MNNEEKDLSKTDAPVTKNTAEGEDQAEATNIPADITSLEEDIIRNDTIPETSKDTPGSSGAFPVGAFENNKD